MLCCFPFADGGKHSQGCLRCTLAFVNLYFRWYLQEEGGKTSFTYVSRMKSEISAYKKKGRELNQWIKEWQAIGSCVHQDPLSPTFLKCLIIPSKCYFITPHLSCLPQCHSCRFACCHNFNEEHIGRKKNLYAVTIFMALSK